MAQDRVCFFCWQFSWCSGKEVFFPFFFSSFFSPFFCFVLVLVLVLDLDFFQIFVHGLKKTEWYLGTAWERILQLPVKEVALPLTALSWEKGTRSDPNRAALLWLLLPGERQGEQRTINTGHFFCLPLCNLPLQIFQILREEMQNPSTDCHCVISSFHQFWLTNSGLAAQVQGLCAHSAQLCLNLKFRILYFLDPLAALMLWQLWPPRGRAHTTNVISAFKSTRIHICCIISTHPYT